MRIPPRIQRFEDIAGEEGLGSAADGYWVRHEDHAAIVDALLAKIEQLETLRLVAAGFDVPDAVGKRGSKL